MTIMVAGGLTFAMPSIMPSAYAATENLFVSAENSAFDNSFAGPMVIQVLVNDPDLKDIDQPEAPPDVTVNGADLTMVQATDGNWYAYIADATMAVRADSQSNINGTALDFGVGCTESSLSDLFTADNARYSGTVGVYFPSADGGSLNGTQLEDCDGVGGDNDADALNVIREHKDPTRTVANSVKLGQIDVKLNEFPAIQLFNFAADGNVEIKYNKGGGPQEIDLTYLDDADSYAKLELDRADYPRGAHVHATITDLQLNIDPTDEDSWTFGTNADGSPSTHYWVTDENGAFTTDNVSAEAFPVLDLTPLNFDENGVLILDIDTQDRGDVLTLVDNADQAINSTHDTYDTFQLAVNDPDVLGAFSGPVTFVETQANSGIFKNTDESDIANIRVTNDADRGTSATITYNDEDQSILVKRYSGTLTIDQSAVGDAWNSGEIIQVTLVDEDLNRNSLVDEDLDLNSADVPIIPAVRIGSPLTLASATGFAVVPNNEAHTANTFSIDDFSDRAVFGSDGTATALGAAAAPTMTFDLGGYDAFLEPGIGEDDVFHYVNYDFRSFGVEQLYTRGTMLSVTVDNGTGDGVIPLIPATRDLKGFVQIDAEDSMPFNGSGSASVTVSFTDAAGDALPIDNYPFVLDLFRFGQIGDGVNADQRLNDAIYRMELEETGDNTGTFAGSMEYTMLNQINVRQNDTYDGVASIDDAIELIIHDDSTDEDSVRVTYFDVGQDGVPTQISAQVEAPTHSGVVTFDADNYKIADTVTITLSDPDLNTDVERVDIFTVVRQSTEQMDNFTFDNAHDMVGITGYGNSTGDANGVPLGRLLDVTFDDALWGSGKYLGCLDATNAIILDEGGLGLTGFTLSETSPSSGIFTGDFQVPDEYCVDKTNRMESTTGVDMEVNYLDYRDISGEIIEVGDSAGIRANTGSVSLDRSVYPIPWGTLGDFTGRGTSAVPNSDSIFPIHPSAVGDDLTDDTILPTGDLMIHVRINDPDFDISASGEDEIAKLADIENDDSTIRGPLLVKISRGSASVILATAGAEEAVNGFITVDNDKRGPNDDTRELGPIDEIAPDAGIFEVDIPIRYTDGPASTNCPDTDAYLPTGGALEPNHVDSDDGTTARFEFSGNEGVTNDSEFCILQGDILTVEYRDPTDASGEPNTVTDSATFDLRNGVLQSDKSVYIIGGDMILTLIEPDFDLDNDSAETYSLDLIEWDSDDATTTMGSIGDPTGAFDPEPSDLRETGDSTGIFQAVIEIPDELNNRDLDRGEEIELEYVDWGPAGSNYVGEEDEDVDLTVFTSNFGATIELDQNVYSWTDKVHITIIAPDHNFDSDLVDEIGNENDEIKVSTGLGRIDRYKLVETGADSGIFTGEVILTGFRYDLYGSGDPANFYTPPPNSDHGTGPTNGFLQADENDGFSVSFTFSEDETVVGSSLVRWNFGEVQWLQASYPATASGVVRVIDPDMNLDPESVNNFDIDVTSDSETAGIDLTVTETNESTGIFEGTVTFTTTDSSSGHRLRVSEGDTVTAEYTDYTLPEPEDRGDSEDITGTTFIGTLVAPLERVIVNDPRVVDSSENPLSNVQVDQQIQITANLASGQEKNQEFAYLVQIQDENGVTLSLDWIRGELPAGGAFSPARSWTPDAPGTYTATIFVWESVGNPIAMAPPTTIEIPVS